MTSFALPQGEQAQEGTYDYDTRLYYINDEIQSTRASESVGGGTWSHGFNGVKLFSYYLHNKNKHSASCKSSNMKSFKTVVSSKKNWARCMIQSSLSGNKVKWNNNVD